MTDEPYEQTHARAQLAHEDYIKLCEEKGWKAQPRVASSVPDISPERIERAISAFCKQLNGHVVYVVPGTIGYEEFKRCLTAVLTSDAPAIEGARAEDAYKCGWKDAQKAASNTAENHGSYEAALDIRGLTPSIERLHEVSEGWAIRSRTPVAAGTDGGWRAALFNLECKASVVAAAYDAKRMLGFPMKELGEAIIAARIALGVLPASPSIRSEETK